MGECSQSSIRIFINTLFMILNILGYNWEYHEDKSHLSLPSYFHLVLQTVTQYLIFQIGSSLFPF